jgi:hypothetical protein
MEQAFSYWIADNQWRSVSGEHADDVIANPSTFGLSSAELETHSQDQEPGNGEAPANGQAAAGRGRHTGLVKEACRNGWLRVRKYTAPSRYLSIVVDDIPSRAHTIRRFLIDILSTGRIATDDTVMLTAFDTGELRTYEWRDGGVGRLLTELGQN